MTKMFSCRAPSRRSWRRRQGGEHLRQTFPAPSSCRSLRACSRSHVGGAIIPKEMIKGDTYHFEVISDTVTSGLMNVGLQTTIKEIAE